MDHGGFMGRANFYRLPSEGMEDGPHCMPRAGRGPGGHGGPVDPGGMPPRRPDPAFLKRRVEEADLMELIDMAGRMAQRQPWGGPARSQALVLSILAGRERLSQRELQQMLGIRPGSLSELLGKLEAKGCLTREKGEDRRGNLLAITPAGREAMTEGEDAPEEDPLSPLTAEEQDELARLLRTLLRGWVETAAEQAPPRSHRGPFPPMRRPVEL